MLDLDVIDPHQHFADLARPYPWLERPAGVDRYHGDDTSLRRSYFVDDYRRDVGDVRVVATVHVENGAGDPLAETRWIQSLCDRNANIPAAHVAKVSLSAPDAERQLDEQASFGCVRGIRDILNWHPDPVYSHTPRDGIIDDPVWRSNFTRLEALGLSFDLQVFAHQLPEAARLAGDNPGVRIILDHAGMPIGRDAESVAQWREGMRAVAAQPNVVVKVSALGTTDHRWSRESIRPFVLDTIEIFGADRAMFASNFPVDGLYSTFGELYSAFDELTADFTAAERQSLFSVTAAAAYRLS